MFFLPTNLYFMKSNHHQSMKKVKDNPSGFAVSGGIAYEHNTTFQRTIRAHKCGDGTVPFFSLSQPSAWRFVSYILKGEAAAFDVNFFPQKTSHC